VVNRTSARSTGIWCARLEHGYRTIETADRSAMIAAGFNRVSALS